MTTGRWRAIPRLLGKVVVVCRRVLRKAHQLRHRSLALAVEVGAVVHPAPKHRYSTAAERQRRRRLRVKMGLALLSIELDPDTLEELIARGLVSQADAACRHNLAFALGVAIEDLLQKAVTP